MVYDISQRCIWYLMYCHCEIKIICSCWCAPRGVCRIVRHLSHLLLYGHCKITMSAVRRSVRIDMNKIIFYLHSSTPQYDIYSLRIHQVRLIQLIYVQIQGMSIGALCDFHLSIFIIASRCSLRCASPKFLGCVSQLYHKEWWPAN